MEPSGGVCRLRFMRSRRLAPVLAPVRAPAGLAAVGLSAATIMAIALSGCAGGAQSPRSPDGAASVITSFGSGPYRASGTVLESPEHGPQLCHNVLTSLPPQCAGIELVGWDWAAVDGEESMNGTTWGEYQVTGTWDGARLTLTEPPGPPSYEPAQTPDFGTPCPEPAGGWQVIDPARTTDGTLNDAIIAANNRADFAGLWLDQPIRGTLSEANANDPTNLILNVRVTGEVAAAEADLREIWGGALCVTAAEFTEEELLGIQAEIGQDPGSINLLSSGLDSQTGTIVVMVALDDGTLQATYDLRYGPGVVKVVSWLRPVD